MPDGLVYFEGLLEEQSFLSNLSILENAYDDATHNRADLDERLFINEEDSLLGFGSLSGGDVNISDIKVRFIFVKAYSPLFGLYALWSSHFI